MHRICRVILAVLALYLAAPLYAAGVQRLDHGISVIPDEGPARQIRVFVYGPGLFRVVETPGPDVEPLPSLMVTATPAGAFSVKQGNDVVTLTTVAGSATISLSSGRVSFADTNGKPVLVQSADPVFTAAEAGGKAYWSTALQFNQGTDEGLFGLGQHQNRQMNYNGEDVELAQHNMDIAVPFLVSTRNYGILWDNNGITRFGNPRPYAAAGADLDISFDGRPGWKADYYLGERLALTRQERTIDYQFIRDQKRWPQEAKAETVASSESGQNTAGVVVGKQRVVWEGNLVATESGTHRFRLYMSSYVKLWVDGQLVIDAWRQNWNPWFRNFDVPMTAGKPVRMRIEWEPNAGYMALLHNGPLPDGDRHSVSFSSDLARSIDYYVTLGDDMDGVIAGYRALTGKAEMLPRWAYGFWQSRQRYETQDQLLDVVRSYRERGIPFDNIVQDWFYWPEDQWGCHCFDKARFPDPAGMVRDVHDLNAQIMISVWPKFYPNTDNAKEFMAKGLLYLGNLDAHEKDWVGPGYENTDYDPYSPEARQIYFRQMKDGLVDMGFDAWWMDATEPDIHSNLSIEERIDRMGPTAIGPAAPLFNSFPLVHADGVAEGLRVAQPDKRPFILTRSGFGGTQRASAALWSGDVAARWSDLRDQISAGVNLSMSGIPNWTHDIGGFAVEDRYSRKDPAALAEWRELNLRWFQFGAFSPLFRSHGETPHREIYEIAEGDPAMYDAMVAYDRLRYRLLPYIYTIAADTYWHDGTMMRGLAMDFPADRRAWNIDDEYLFGPAFLVAPVTEFGAHRRDVYLPAGSGWYDWSTGAWFAGGQTIEVDAPRERMPLFVRAGSIVVSGSDVQYAAEKRDGPLVVHVFAGTDGHFSLYEDDGVSPSYKEGGYSRIPMSWDEASRSLTIGARDGAYAGMVGDRTISVRVHDKGSSTQVDFDIDPHRQFTYNGEAIRISLPGQPRSD